VDWSKLDPALHSSLARDPEGFVDVIIQCDPDARADVISDLTTNGRLEPASVGKDFVRASVTPEDLDELSERPLVRSISLTQAMRPVGEPMNDA
jgi:hypothetical protein